MAEALAVPAARATAVVATAPVVRTSHALRREHRGHRAVGRVRAVATRARRPVCPGLPVAARARRAFRTCRNRRLGRISHRLGRAVRRLRWGCLVPPRPIVLPADRNCHPAVSTGPAETVDRPRASRDLPPVVTDSPERATDRRSDRPVRWPPRLAPIPHRSAVVIGLRSAAIVPTGRARDRVFLVGQVEIDPQSVEIVLEFLNARPPCRVI
jgi:hypothetical protein